MIRRALLFSVLLACQPLSAQVRTLEPLGLPPSEAPLAVETPATAALPAEAASLPLSDARPLDRLPTEPLPAVEAPAPGLSALHSAPSDRKPEAGSVAGVLRKVPRSDRPAPPSDAQLEALFDQAMPGSAAVSELNGRGRFADSAVHILTHYSFLSQTFRDEEALTAQGARRDLHAVMDRESEPAPRLFLEALGRRAAHDFETGARHGRYLLPRTPALPENPLGRGAYWDMASGLNAFNFILRELKAGTEYFFFDRSPFVVSALREMARITGAKASIVEADILELPPPRERLAVLRSKNTIAYVPGFEDKLERMADWVAPGGRLILQTDPKPAQHRSLSERHRRLALQLLEEGWAFEYDIVAQGSGKGHLDTLIFTRPQGSATRRAPEEANRIWDAFVAELHIGDSKPRFYIRIF